MKTCLQQERTVLRSNFLSNKIQPQLEGNYTEVFSTKIAKSQGRDLLAVTFQMSPSSGFLSTWWEAWQIMNSCVSMKSSRTFTFLHLLRSFRMGHVCMLHVRCVRVQAVNEDDEWERTGPKKPWQLPERWINLRQNRRMRSRGLWVCVLLKGSYYSLFTRWNLSRKCPECVCAASVQNASWITYYTML